MMKMNWKEVQFWYSNFELQITEEEVVNELSYDKKTGKSKKLPKYERIREMVELRIKERRNGK